MSKQHTLSRSWLGIVVLISLFLAGCTPLPTPAPATSPLAGPTSTAPASQDAPAVASEATVGVPAPAEGFGAVTGVVLTEATGQVPAQAVMYLGLFVVGENNFPIVSVDRQTAPSGIPSPSTGRFVITDVPPGKYGLSFWTPDGNVLVNDPANPQYSLILTVEAGKVLDIGTLTVPAL